MVRLSLLTSKHMLFGQQIMTAETYNRMFTLHGVVMVFLFIIPAIPASLGNFVLPLMLGAKDVAFPRLNLASFYLWVTGASWRSPPWCSAASTRAGPSIRPIRTTTERHRHADDAWPCSCWVSRPSSPASISSPPSTSCARPGMGWFDMPLFLWGIYSTAMIQVLATPVLGITLVLLAARTRPSASASSIRKLGGDPVLFQHFFWFYSHPAVYIMILPGMAIISRADPDVLAQDDLWLPRHRLFELSLALVELHRVGSSHVRRGPVAARDRDLLALTFLVAIPSGVKMFNWLATMYQRQHLA